jgi:chitinase
MSGMVESVEISRVNIRDTLSLDLSVWMNHPDDMDFRPSLSCKNKTITISSISSGEALASVELDDDQMQALEASLTAELRVKFQVHGMHGRLNKIAPIIADGKAKKLATANWKTVQQAKAPRKKHVSNV